MSFLNFKKCGVLETKWFFVHFAIWCSWCCESWVWHPPRWARHSEWNIVVVKVNHWTHFCLFVWPMIWGWVNKCLFGFCWRIVDLTWQTFCYMPITDSISQLIERVSFVFGRLCSCHSVIALGGQFCWNWSKVSVNRDLLNVERAVWFPVFWTCHRPHHVSGVRGPGKGSLFFRWIAYVIYSGSCLIPLSMLRRSPSATAMTSYVPVTFVKIAVQLQNHPLEPPTRWNATMHNGRSW